MMNIPSSSISETSLLSHDPYGISSFNTEELKSTQKGDSGSPIFQNGKLVGILAGGDAEVNSFVNLKIFNSWIIKNRE